MDVGKGQACPPWVGGVPAVQVNLGVLVGPCGPQGCWRVLGTAGAPSLSPHLCLSSLCGSDWHSFESTSSHQSLPETVSTLRGAPALVCPLSDAEVRNPSFSWVSPHV